MKGKIVFEEHMAIEETLGHSRAIAAESGRWDEFTLELLDMDKRLSDMDAAGIELSIISLNAPGLQSILDREGAVEIAGKANNRIAQWVARHPGRYAGLAALPMQDPAAASAELERCINDLGFKGALVNGFTQKDNPDSAVYYDIPDYRDFWATVSDLDVPFYLHPRMQIPAQARNYEGHPWLMSSPWGFAVETSIHALRLCGSGIFDDFPNLKIILGHLGENIPFGLWRIDERMRFSSTRLSRQTPTRRILSATFPYYDQRQLQRSGFPVHPGRYGQGQGLLLHRLSVCKDGGCRRLV